MAINAGWEFRGSSFHRVSDFVMLTLKNLSGFTIVLSSNSKYAIKEGPLI